MRTDACVPPGVVRLVFARRCMHACACSCLASAARCPCMWYAACCDARFCRIFLVRCRLLNHRRSFSSSPAQCRPPPHSTRRGALRCASALSCPCAAVSQVPSQRSVSRGIARARPADGRLVSAGCRRRGCPVCHDRFRHAPCARPRRAAGEGRRAHPRRCDQFRRCKLAGAWRGRGARLLRRGGLRSRHPPAHARHDVASLAATAAEGNSGKATVPEGEPARGLNRRARRPLRLGGAGGREESVAAGGDTATAAAAIDCAQVARG